MVDRACAELDGERHRPDLGQLIAVEAEREPGGATREQVAACLLDVERPPLDEDVRGDCDARRVRQHLGNHPIDVGIRVGMLGWDGVRAEPGRHAPGGPNRLELGELGVVVEAVPTLALEGRGPVGQHRGSMTRDDRLERDETRGPRRTGRRQDPAAGCEELLVRRAGAPQRELVRAIAGERRVRVAVDEPGDRREPSAVDLLDVAVERWQVAHAPDLLDEAVTHQDVCILDDLDPAERVAAKRCVIPRRRRELGEVSNDEPTHGSITS